MATSNQEALLNRTTKVLGFFIGICGALAILGVFFKILEYPGYELFMQLGFIGEAAAFVIMGSLELAQAVMMDGPDGEETSGGAKRDDGAAKKGGPNGEAVEEAPYTAPPIGVPARDMLEEKVTEELDRRMEGVQEEIEAFGGEIREMADEMSRARRAVRELRSTLREAATETLPEDAEQLGQGMEALGSEMERAESAAKEMRADLGAMLRRFRQFNAPRKAQAGAESMRSPAEAQTSSNGASGPTDDSESDSTTD